MSTNYLKCEVVVHQGEKKPEFKVMIGNHEIGTSKTDFDARFHMHAINDALESAYQAGKDDLVVTVAEACTQKQVSGPQCKYCGAFTTYKRVEGTGLCMKCEIRGFCTQCGAGIGINRREGEGTCPTCSKC